MGKVIKNWIKVLTLFVISLTGLVHISYMAKTSLKDDYGDLGHRFVSGRDNRRTSSIRYHIGVLSTQKYLSTRADNVFQTWGQDTQSLSFYLGEESVQSRLPITYLTGVKDNTYPPQQKSFQMIKYWCDNYADDYDWFIKADDDTYIKVALLEYLLWGLDPNIKYYIGNPLTGNLKRRRPFRMYHNTYCGGPTVIFSKAVMKELCPHINACLSRVVSKHEDTEIARCVFFHAGIQCDAGKEPSKLFFATREDVFGKTLSAMGELGDALSLHSVKRSSEMYNLHYYYKQWLASGNLTQQPNQRNPFGIRSLKANLTKEECQRENCTYANSR